MERSTVSTLKFGHWIALIILLTFGVIILTAFITAPSFELSQKLIEERLTASQNEGPAKSSLQKKITVGVYTGESSEILIPSNLRPQQDTLPGFMFYKDFKLSISPGKYDSGNYQVVFNDTKNLTGENQIYDIQISRKGYSTLELNQIVTDTLGANLDKFGVQVIDLLSDTRSGVNAENVLLPGSLAKLPVVILALRDIDSGKISFEDEVIIQEHLKHSQTDDVGKLANGSSISVQALIEYSILQSNNSAMYHLRDYIGGIGIVDQRTRSELGVNTFHDAYTHAAIARNVGKVFEDLYDGRLLSKTRTDYLLDLMQRPLAHLREGIPFALANKNVRVANKVGFLYGGKDNSYVDAAIVYGASTDFVLVVLDKETSVEDGREMVRLLASAVYDFLN